MIRTRSFLLLAACGALAACSSGSGAATTTAAGEPAPAAARKKADRNLLTSDELTEPQRQLSVYDAVQNFRPNFLHGSGAMTTGSRGLTVYVDGAKYGALSTLKDIRMYEVIDVRYLSASEASNRYGTGNEGGVLLVRRKKS